MFIDQGTLVDVMAGACAGRVGWVRKIRINDHDGSVLVWVDVITHSGADFELMLFEPIQLKRRKVTPVQLERMELVYESHLAQA